jgi:periplasmic copper chaperone A
MRKIQMTTTVVCLFSCVAVAAAAAMAQAQDAHKHGSPMPPAQMSTETSAVTKGLNVVGAWSRATPGQSKNGAVFLEIKSDRADQLLSASGAVADAIEIHTHINDNGIMQMRRVDAVEIAEGATKFVPGGYHIMLLGLKQPLKAGDTFKLTLTFAAAGARDVEVAVRSNTAAPAKGHTH